MMRRGEHVAVAVRREDGEVVLWEERRRPFLVGHKWLDIPILRGLIAVLETMAIGYRALGASANLHLEGQGQKKVGGVAMGLTFAGSFVIALALLIILPSLVADALSGLLRNGRLVAFADGAVRMAIVLAYIAGVGAMPQVRRYFEYHGAEHRTVAAFEAGEELTVENVQRFSSFHPRCGTSLVALVVLVKFLVLPLFGWGTWGERLLTRFLALPIVAGIALEGIRTASKRPHVKPLQWLVAPGMWLQRLTAHQPTDAQVEVAIRALKAVTGPQN